MQTVQDNVGRFVRVETRTGVQRSGRLTNIYAGKLQLNGVEVSIVQEIELNSDRGDTIPIASLVRIDFDKPESIT